MRTHVTFRHPAEFVPLSDDEGILGVSGAQWFVSLLRRVSGLQIEDDLCQEDWGVVVFARRDQKKFWIGLSPWDFEGAWVAHFLHGSFVSLRWFNSSSRTAMQRLLVDVHGMLASEPAVSEIVWYDESEMKKRRPTGFPTPVDG